MDVYDAPAALPVPAPDPLREALEACYQELEREHGHSSAWPDNTWPSCALVHDALRLARAVLREGDTRPNDDYLAAAQTLDGEASGGPQMDLTGDSVKVAALRGETP